MTVSPQTTATNQVAEIREFGQSVWLDFIRRGLIVSGELQRMVNDDRLEGVTSNPASFARAIETSDDYAAAIADLANGPPLSPKRIYEILAVEDIRCAADVLRPVYDETGGRDGYVSLAVAPDLAYDTVGTIAEARRLWAEVRRPNLMIQVPATPFGIPAIQTLLVEGINVNVTLLLAPSAYERVAEAFLNALEIRAGYGRPLDRLASVASFFVSRIDTAVDACLAAKSVGAATLDRARMDALVGKAAIANAKVSYQSYKRIFSGPRWEALRARGGQTQRLLWASTGVKNPRYRHVRYVEELIGPDTVSTVPPETLAAFREHGRPRARLAENLTEAMEVLARLEREGISLAEVTDELLADGVDKLAKPWRKLLNAVGHRVSQARRSSLVDAPASAALPVAHAA